MLAPPVATRLKLAHSAGASKLDATRPAVSHPSAIFAGAAQSTVSARTPDGGIGSRHGAHRTAHAHARRSDLGGSAAGRQQKAHEQREHARPRVLQNWTSPGPTVWPEPIMRAMLGFRYSGFSA